MAGGDLTPLIVTYTYICFSGRSTGGYPPDSTLTGMLPYRHYNLMYCPASSASALYPIIIHAQTLD